MGATRYKVSVLPDVPATTEAHDGFARARGDAMTLTDSETSTNTRLAVRRRVSPNARGVAGTWPRLLMVGVIGLVVAAVGVPVAGAATLTVTDGGDTGSATRLRQIVAAAGRGRRRAWRSMATFVIVATCAGLVQLAGIEPAHADIVTEILAEGFDGVTPPALPAGWTATRAAGQGTDQTWRTSTPGLYSHTMPNSVSVGAYGHVTDMILESTPFQAGSATRVQWAQRVNLQATTGQFSGDSLDGGVLEIKIGTAAYVDFVAAGGSFLYENGYDHRIASTQSNPLGGRMGWAGVDLFGPGYHTAILPS
jgi:hypothetical protein